MILSLQFNTNGKRIHDYSVIFAGRLIKPAFDRFNSVFRSVFGFVYNITYFHVKRPILAW